MTSRLPSPRPADRSVSPNGGPRLVGVDGTAKGRSFLLSGDGLSIGRQESNDLQLREGAVSRRHCEIQLADGGFELRDLGSTQGTFVNRRPVERRRLVHGDLVQIGATVLLFLDEPSEEGEGHLAPSPDAGSTVEKNPSQIAELLRGHGARDSAGDARFLLRLATAVQEARSADVLVERLLDWAIEALPVERAKVLRLAPEEDRPRAWASRGDEIVLSRTVVSRVLGEGMAVWWDAIDPGAGLPASKSLLIGAARSVLAAPLAGRRDLHGLLYLESSAVGSIAEAHLELTATAAALAGLALDTVRAFEDLREENRQLRGGAHGLVGESSAMERLQDFIARVGPVDSTVLLRGESGTGKELVANALHEASPRVDGPFVAINCATLSETLLESELFGHEKGSFTGAVARKVGRFEAAEGGTLFLDEIGEMPVTLQARLLRALQERSFERVGGTSPIKADVRVIAATHRDLESAIGEGRFREDLFYRLNVITCRLPSLRERKQDVPLLARHFVHHLGERLGRTGVGLDPKALRALAAYDWPGNVRQLSNAIERALVLGDGEHLRFEDLPEEILDQVPPDEVEVGDYQAVLTETKKRLLTTALEEAGGNAAEAGRRLGLHPNSFRRLMRRLGLRDVDI